MNGILDPKNYFHLVSRIRMNSSDSDSKPIQILNLQKKILLLKLHISVNATDSDAPIALLKLINRRQKYLNDIRSYNSRTYRLLMDELQLY
jgi:ribosomal protein S15